MTNTHTLWSITAEGVRERGEFPTLDAAIAEWSALDEAAISCGMKVTRYKNGTPDASVNFVRRELVLTHPCEVCGERAPDHTASCTLAHPVALGTCVVCGRPSSPPKSSLDVATLPLCKSHRFGACAFRRHLRLASPEVVRFMIHAYGDGTPRNAAPVSSPVASRTRSPVPTPRAKPAHRPTTARSEGTPQLVRVAALLTRFGGMDAAERASLVVERAGGVSVLESFLDAMEVRS